MELHQKKFNELTPLELYKIMQLRMSVFILEQNCIYQDLDNKDLISTHIFYTDNDKIVAYTRAIPRGVSFPEASFGRVCVDINYRSQKLGAKIVDETIKYMLGTKEFDKITIGAQEYLRKFYASFGFKEIGDVYTEDDIPHVDMTLTKEDYLAK